jgi:hypothetical protein
MLFYKEAFFLTNETVEITIEVSAVPRYHLGASQSSPQGESVEKKANMLLSLSIVVVTRFVLLHPRGT